MNRLDYRLYFIVYILELITQVHKILIIIIILPKDKITGKYLIQSAVY